MRTEHNFEYTAQLIIKFLKNELSASEKAEFELWRASDPDNEELIRSFSDTGTVQAEMGQLHNIDVAQGYEDVLKRINKQQRTRPLWNNILRYASAAVICVGLSFIVYMLRHLNKPSSPIASVADKKYDIMPGKKRAFLSLADGSTIDLNAADLSPVQKDGATIDASNGTLVYNSPKNNKANGYNLLRTPKAGEYKMVLPDGSRVWLNALSSLRFPESFNKGERRVELSGEAYFEVAHNKAKPFIVSFNGTEVKVLGTHFNISTYNTESKTTLLEGAISIKKGAQERLLKPGDEATVLANTVKVNPTDTYRSTAWKDGVFYFNEDKMTDILDQVSRWYDVDIVYNGKPGAKKYSGNIRREATLNQVLEMLNVLSGTKFTLKDRTVTVDLTSNSHN